MKTKTCLITSLSKTTLSILLLLISLSGKAFFASFDIIANPSDAKIYVDNEYKGTGKCYVAIYEAKDIEIRIEREGYTTYKMKYGYNRALNDNSKQPYTRGGNKFKIELAPAKSGESFSSSGGDTKSETIAKLGILTKDGLVTADESVVLKDNIIDNKENGYKTVNELSNLRKLVNMSFIAKEDFFSIKSKVMGSSYNFNESASSKLQNLINKAESGEYTKDEIDRLKKMIINSYK